METAGFRFPEKIIIYSFSMKATFWGFTHLHYDIKDSVVTFATENTFLLPPLTCPVKQAIDITPNPKARET